MKSPLRKDLAISLMGHISVIAIIIIVNPATGVLGGSTEVMTVNLGALGGPEPGGAPPAQEQEQQQAEPEPEEIKPPEIPVVEPDQAVSESFKLASNDSLETIVDEPEPEPEPEKPKPKPKPAEEKPKPEPQEPTHAQTESKPPAEKPTEETGVKEVTSSEGRGLDITSAVGEGDGSGSGSGSGGFGLPYDISLLERKIERSWRNPVTSSNQVTCTVYFQVGRDGQLLGRPVIEKASGITTFDNEALYAIMRVDRFPAFPSGFEYDYIGIHLDFTYDPQ